MEIGVWGDSITYGAGDSAGLGWVGRLRVKLADQDIEIYNRGVCGDTTEKLLARFSVEASSIEPQCIVFAIGINDSKYRAGTETPLVPIEQFAANIRELIAQAQKYTATVFLLGPTRVLTGEITGTKSRFLNPTIESYEQTLAEAAAATDVTFISVAEVLNVSEDLADGLHPNERGYSKLAEYLQPRLMADIDHHKSLC